MLRISNVNLLHQDSRKILKASNYTFSPFLLSPFPQPRLSLSLLCLAFAFASPSSSFSTLLPSNFRTILLIVNPGGHIFSPTPADKHSPFFRPLFTTFFARFSALSFVRRHLIFVHYRSTKLEAFLWKTHLS